MTNTPITPEENTEALSREAFEVFRVAKGDWMLRNQEKALHSDYQDTAEEHGLMAALAYADSQRGKQAQQGGDVVDRVARAIHDACAEIERPSPRSIPFYAINSHKEEWRLMAKAALSAIPHPTPSKSVALLKEAISRELHEEKSGFWRTCTGCYEGVDGQNVYGFPESDLFDCIIGHGCSECGGIGATWDNIDYEAAYRGSLSEQPPEQARGIAALGEDEAVEIMWEAMEPHIVMPKNASKAIIEAYRALMEATDGQNAAGVINVKGEGLLAVAYGSHTITEVDCAAEAQETMQKIEAKLKGK